MSLQPELACELVIDGKTLSHIIGETAADPHPGSLLPVQDTYPIDQAYAEGSINHWQIFVSRIVSKIPEEKSLA